MFAGSRVSLKTASAIRSATSDSPDASAPTPHGSCANNSNPKYAMSGPSVNPAPNAIPISAIPFARFSGVVQSAITAAAVPTLAPAMPAPIRASSMSAMASSAWFASRVTAKP